MAQSSGPLVPSSGFSQQGQVDWVAFSRSSVGFSVDVLNRLSKANIDPMTMVMGCATCQNLVIPPEAQRRVQEALQSLPSYTSYGKVLWFGFGVRHVIYDLSSSEQGISCVALCAAMGHTYGSWFAAKTLRDLAASRSAPSNLTPSVYQWYNLVDACAGSLSSSKLSSLIRGFSQMICPPRSTIDFRVPGATTSSALCKALLLIADVSNGRAQSCSFSGGLDCAWLAAVAEWLYCLSVEISKGDQVLYRSNSPASSNRVPQIKILLDDNDGLRGPTQVLLKTFHLPSGAALLYRELEKADYRSDHFWIYSTWSSVLCDTFGSAFSRLLHAPCRKHFCLLLEFFVTPYCCNSGNPKEEYYDRAWSCRNQYRENWPSFIFQHGCSRDDIINKSIMCLPELKHCLQEVQKSGGSSCNSHTKVTSALARIADICACKHYTECTELICLRRLAVTIIKLLHILLRSDIHDSIQPIATSVADFYTNHGSHICLVTCDSFVIPKSPLDLEVLVNLISKPSGETMPKKLGLNEERPIAVARDGFCAFYKLLQEPNSPPWQAACIAVTPGRIEHESTSPSFVKDVRMDYQRSAQCFPVREEEQVKLEVEEMPRSNTLRCCYLITAPETTAIIKSDSRKSHVGVRFTIGSTIRCLNKQINAICGCFCAKHDSARTVIQFGPLSNRVPHKVQVSISSSPDEINRGRTAGSAQGVRNHNHLTCMSCRDPNLYELLKVYAPFVRSSLGTQFDGITRLHISINRLSSPTCQAETIPDSTSSLLMSYARIYAEQQLSPPDDVDRQTSLHGHFSCCLLCLLHVALERMEDKHGFIYKAVIYGKQLVHGKLDCNDGRDPVVFTIEQDQESQAQESQAQEIRTKKGRPKKGRSRKNKGQRE